MINFLIKFVALILCIVAIAAGVYFSFVQSDLSAIESDFAEATSGPWLPEELAGLIPSFQETPGAE